MACPSPENTLLSEPEMDPLENLLIEHPSMSVYKIKCGSGKAEEEERGSDEDEEQTARLQTFSVFTDMHTKQTELLLNRKHYFSELNFSRSWT